MEGDNHADYTNTLIFDDIPTSSKDCLKNMQNLSIYLLLVKLEGQ